MTLRRFLGNGMGKIPSWLDVLFNDPCPYCGGKSDSREHVTPISRKSGDGSNASAKLRDVLNYTKLPLDNIVGACKKCNNDRRAVPNVLWWAAKNGFIRNQHGQRVQLIEQGASDAYVTIN